MGDDQSVDATEQTRVVRMEKAAIEDATRAYGLEWLQHFQRLLDAADHRRPILELFDIGRIPVGAPYGQSRVRRSRPTEELFLERCINLARPGGRIGIVLPDGILNNPSSDWLRRYVEGRAKLLAVVSIPHEVFRSAKATIKTSLVFLRRFTREEAVAWNAARQRFLQEATIDRHDDGRPRSALRTGVGRDAVALDTEVTAHLREQFSYPVFLAEVDSAGITATGDTGAHVPNQLPDVLSQFRQFLSDSEAFLRQPVADPT